MALATVAGVIGVMGSAAVGSLSVRHHYFQGAGQASSAQHGVPIEITSQLTGEDEPAPLAFMLLSDLALQPRLKNQGQQRQSDAGPASGDGPMTSQFFNLPFGEGGGLGALAAGQDAASAQGVVQNGLPDTSRSPDAPPSAAPAQGGAPAFGGAGFFAPPSPPPGPPPTVDPPVLVLPPVLPPVLPMPPPIPDSGPPPSVPLIGPPQQGGGSAGPPVTSAIPEPATWFLFVLGLGLTGAVMPGRRSDRRRLEPFPLTMVHREWRRRAPDISDDPVLSRLT